MKKILLGNEAIVQGALEAGVNFVSVYPGTPSSEIGDIFSKIAERHGIYFEFSTNEKVALEAGIGASYSGLKTLVAMKNFGLNVALDAFLPFVYTGTVGPTVIIVADDPSCHSSGQSEENTRPFGDLAHVVVLEPSDAQESKDFIIFAFELSEKFNIPVVLRITTRVAHQRMPVEISDNQFPISNFKEGIFVKNTKKFVTMPPRVMEMKNELLKKIEEVRKLSEKNPINKIYKGLNSAKFGIVTSGVSYLYIKEVLGELGLEVPVMKIGFFNPLPNKKIKAFIKNLKKVLVVEELEGYLEREINVLAKEVNPKLKIYGKDLLPVTGELNTDKILFAISKLLGKKLNNRRPLKSAQIPKRFPKLCQGCPYWLVFAAIKKMAPEGTVFGGDIGCYMIAGFPPHEIQDYMLCMGSSISIGHGIKKASQNKQKLISLIGDSTFFHSGIPALINSVYNKSNPLIIVLDNRITAMTGHQPNAGEIIKIEDVAMACGVKNIKVIDPTNINELQQTILEFINKDETSVIVARKMCAYYARKIVNK